MGSDDKIRVVIVDDVAETRENIRRLLQFENDVEVVGVAGTGRDAIAVAKDVRPDVVLMDMMMPVMNGGEATRRIMALGKPITVIALTSFHEQNHGWRKDR